MNVCNCWVPSSTHRRGQSVPVDSNYRSTQKITQHVCSPSGSRGYQDLDKLTLSDSILAAVSVSAPFPLIGTHVPAVTLGLALVRSPRLPWGFAKLSAGLPGREALLLLSRPASLSLRAGVLCPVPLPFPGLPSAPTPCDCPYPSHTVCPLLAHCTLCLPCSWFILHSILCL